MEWQISNDDTALMNSNQMTKDGTGISCSRVFGFNLEIKLQTPVRVNVSLRV